MTLDDLDILVEALALALLLSWYAWRKRKRKRAQGRWSAEREQRKADIVDFHIRTLRDPSVHAPLAVLDATAALEWVSTDQVRTLFPLVTDPNPFVAALATSMVRKKGDDAAIALLRAAKATHPDLESDYRHALIFRGSEALHDEKEVYITHADSHIRGEALVSLAATLEHPSPSFGRTSAAERLIAALSVEADLEIVRQVVRQLMTHKLESLVSHWNQLTETTRAEIVRDFPSFGQAERRHAMAAIFREVLVGRAGTHENDAARRAPVESQPAQLAPPEDDVHPAPTLSEWHFLTIVADAATAPCMGGVLSIEKGDLRVKIRFAHQRRPESHWVRVELVLADSEGREWMFESYVRGSSFTGAFEDDRRRSLASAKTFVAWSDAPTAWKRALEERCLLARVLDLLDDRSIFDLAISGRRHRLQLKYQTPQIDVAVLDSGLVVRVSELMEWTQTDDYEPLPPFAWLAPAKLLVCFAEPFGHCSTLDELGEGTEPEQCARSVGKPLGSRDTAQSSVVFRAEPGPAHQS